MDYRLLADSAVLAGEIILKNGAETYIVETTIKKVLLKGNFKHVEAVVMATSIIATISNPDMDPITVIRKINRRTTNLNKIYLVQEAVEEFLNDKINLEKFFQKLKSIRKSKQYSNKLINISTVLVAPAFTVMLGGNIIDAISSAICGTALMIVLKLKNIIHYNHFLIYILSTMLVSILAVICSRIINNNIDLTIIGAIMPVVPGVLLTNSIRDSINGDYIASIARLSEALIIALAVALRNRIRNIYM